MLGDPSEGPVSIFLGLFMGGMLFFFGLATISYLIMFVFAKDRFNPGYQPNRRELWLSVKWSVLCLLGNAVLTAPIHWAIANGYSQVYYDIGDYGWGWILSSIVIMLVITETLIYWIHRALHSDRLWWVHETHHQFKETTPFTGVAFNPLDSFAQAVPHHLCVFLFPMHANVYLLSVSVVTMWAVLIHDRVSFVPFKWINYTAHHTLHHWYGDYNYGQYFTFWDRWCGTYKDPDACAGEVPDTVLHPPLSFLRRPPRRG